LSSYRKSTFIPTALSSALPLSADICQAMILPSAKPPMIIQFTPSIDNYRNFPIARCALKVLSLVLTIAKAELAVDQFLGICVAINAITSLRAVSGIADHDRD
jgi:hypothetical protein